MSRKQHKQSVEAASGAPSRKNERLLPEEAAQVRELIASKHSKTALQLAKDLHKRCAAAESETLLIEAYTARIDDLLKSGMTVEAKSLLAVVQERFPAALPRLAELGREICALDGRLEEVVGPLRDPNLPAEDRDRIESFIRQRIHDLPALAAVSSLPQEHSLRVAAAALAAAFKAVTAGPVNDALLALPEVSRRSPLASWKALVRAIACYHRREDEECRKWLLTIADDSIPARLLPAAAAMLGKKSDSKFTPAEEKLIDVAGDHSVALHTAVANLEKAFQAKKHRAILDAVRSVAAASERCEPALRERLRQHIAVLSIMQHLPLPSVHAALGHRPRQDAYYYRLLARTLENEQHVEGYAEAALVWVDFRREAIKENWFTAVSLEDGVLTLHMAQLIEKLPAELVEAIKGSQPFHRKPAKWNEDEGLPSAEALYRRACEADPHPEGFQSWLSWARQLGPWQEADSVAEQWRKARPADIQPLLHLMESSERRGAFKKSLKYLEEAENLDRLSPEVRRAKLRLVLSAVLRHMSQRKTHLAQGGIEQIKTMPEVRPGEIAALVAALRWCSAAVDGDKSAQREREAELNQAIGCVAAHLLIAALLDAAKMSGTTSTALKVPSTPALELLTGAVKACVLGEGVGLRIPLPRGWNDQLIAALYLPNCPLDAAQMQVLGEAALESLAFELTYALSSVGLARGKADARFLFLRARCLPPFAALRRDGCFTAALELARRERNTELAGKILDRLSGDRSNGNARRGYGRSLGDDPRIASSPVSPELLSQIIEEEKALEQFPLYGSYRRPKYAPALGPSRCDCPNCRAQRGEAIDDSEAWDDEDEDDFADDDEIEEGPPPSLEQMAEMLDEFMGSLPPAMAQAVASQLKKAMAAGEDPFTTLERIVNREALRPRQPARPGKTDKVLPKQGSLF
jgi:tetratricopeptide (TPR) repeat protein